MKFLIFHFIKFEIFNTDDDALGSLEKNFQQTYLALIC